MPKKPPCPRGSEENIYTGFCKKACKSDEARQSYEPYNCTQQELTRLSLAGSQYNGMLQMNMNEIIRRENMMAAEAAHAEKERLQSMVDSQENARIASIREQSERDERERVARISNDILIRDQMMADARDTIAREQAQSREAIIREKAIRDQAQENIARVQASSRREIEESQAANARAQEERDNFAKMEIDRIQSEARAVQEQADQKEAERSRDKSKDMIKNIRKDAQAKRDKADEEQYAREQKKVKDDRDSINKIREDADALRVKSEREQAEREKEEVQDQREKSIRARAAIDAHREYADRYIDEGGQEEAQRERNKEKAMKRRAEIDAQREYADQHIDEGGQEEAQRERNREKAIKRRADIQAQLEYNDMQEAIGNAVESERAKILSKAQEDAETDAANRKILEETREGEVRAAMAIYKMQMKDLKRIKRSLEQKVEDLQKIIKSRGTSSSTNTRTQSRDQEDRQRETSIKLTRDLEEGDWGKTISSYNIRIEAANGNPRLQQLIRGELGYRERSRNDAILLENGMEEIHDAETGNSRLVEDIKFAQEDASTLKSQDEDVDDSNISVMERVRRLNR